jgi:hypothetical protein
MLIFCKTNEVARGGCRWRIPLPGGWQVRWQRPGCSITSMPAHMRKGPW